MDINTKLKDELESKEFYKYLLKLKTELRKLVKKEQFDDFLTNIITAVSNLVDYNEKESILDLIKFLLDIFDQNSSKIKNKISFIKTFSVIAEKIVKLKCDLGNLLHNLKLICEKNKIDENELKENKVYLTVAKCYIYMEYYSKAYKYSLLHDDPILINEALKLLYTHSVKDITSLEKTYFILRACFEIILSKRLKTAFEFIKMNCDYASFEKNHPLMNFAFCLCLLLSNYCEFDNFWFLISQYKISIEYEENLVYYLNKISMIYFDKPILKDQQNNNVLNLLKLISK
jgi:hypothetical protein